MNFKRWYIALGAILLMCVWADPAAAETADDEVRDAPQMEGLIGGEQPWERAFDQAMLEGREHYNADEREAARDAFVRAIQILPEAPAPYRNLARNYNLMAEYGPASAFYDQYLRLAPDAEDREIIDRERRGTVTRAGDETWRAPANQRMAKRALERELDDGRALTEDEGGAWGLYKTLLGTGYVSPDLEGLRQRLEAMLVDEAEEHFRREGGFLPVLGRQEWALQRQRLEGLRELARDEEFLAFAQRRALVVDAVEALWTESYDEAIAGAMEAMQANEDLAFVGWYRVLALERTGRVDEALRALDELVEARAFAGEGLRRVEAVRAQLLQQQGHSEDAAEVYRRVLMR